MVVVGLEVAGRMSGPLMDGERSLRVWILILGRREGQSRAR